MRKGAVVLQRIILHVDCNKFYASVECVVRNLNPFSTNLIVADKSRGQGAITLAIFWRSYVLI